MWFQCYKKVKPTFYNLTIYKITWDQIIAHVLKYLYATKVPKTKNKFYFCLDYFFIEK